MIEPAIDSFGRVHRSLRVSVTDRCNLRCKYCMPAAGLPFAPREELLTFEEITFAVQVAVKLGIDRIRITGGEPLLRRDLQDLIAMLSQETGLKDLAMTTNALLLDRYAEPLARAGLNRLNISLDSLRPDRFEQITRFGLLEKTLRGIEAAEEAGIRPIRINTLLLEGFNEDEVDQWLDMIMVREIDVRFMELMPVGEGAELKRLGSYYNLTQLRKRLQEERGLERADDLSSGQGKGNGPARYWRLPGAKGRVGFITPISNSYCNTCSRMRLTSVGDLRACLAFDEHLSIRDAIRARDEEEVIARFRQALHEKKAGHHWKEGQETVVGMSALGG